MPRPCCSWPTARPCWHGAWRTRISAISAAPFGVIPPSLEIPLGALVVDAGSRSLETAAELAKWPLDPLLGWLYDWVCDLLKFQQQPGVALVHQDYRDQLQALAAMVPAQALYGFMDQLLQLKRAQSIPLNSQMLWEDLLLSWERLITRAKAKG